MLLPQELFNEAISWLGQELGLSGRLTDLPDITTERPKLVELQIPMQSGQDSETPTRRKRRTAQNAGKQVRKKKHLTSFDMSVRCKGVGVIVDTKWHDDIVLSCNVMPLA